MMRKILFFIEINIFFWRTRGIHLDYFRIFTPNFSRTIQIFFDKFSWCGDRGNVWWWVCTLAWGWDWWKFVWFIGIIIFCMKMGRLLVGFRGFLNGWTLLLNAWTSFLNAPFDCLNETLSIKSPRKIKTIKN